jgi:hypothetical protein
MKQYLFIIYTLDPITDNLIIITLQKMNLGPFQYFVTEDDS